MRPCAPTRSVAPAPCSSRLHGSSPTHKSTGVASRLGPAGLRCTTSQSYTNAHSAGERGHGTSWIAISACRLPIADPAAPDTAHAVRTRAAKRIARARSKGGKRRLRDARARPPCTAARARRGTDQVSVRARFRGRCRRRRRAAHRPRPCPRRIARPAQRRRPAAPAPSSAGAPRRRPRSPWSRLRAPTDETVRLSDGQTETDDQTETDGQTETDSQTETASLGHAHTEQPAHRAAPSDGTKHAAGQLRASRRGQRTAERRVASEDKQPAGRCGEKPAEVPAGRSGSAGHLELRPGERARVEAEHVRREPCAPLAPSGLARQSKSEMQPEQTMRTPSASPSAVDVEGIPDCREPEVGARRWDRTRDRRRKVLPLARDGVVHQDVVLVHCPTYPTSA
eukprot:2459546-Rhodomonas_salina.2